jgi:hypothetical protein
MSGNDLVKEVRDGGFPERPLLPRGSKPGGILEEHRRAREEFRTSVSGMTVGHPSETGNSLGPPVIRFFLKVQTAG